MSLDLRHIESFVAVADTRSFSSAAERTGTVQSAVSAHIRLLEQRLSRKLVERGRGKPVSLTHDGNAFLIKARRLLVLADEAMEGSSISGTASPIRLGTTMTFALSALPPALARFAMAAPDNPVTVTTARSHDLRDLLDNGSIDIALVLDQGPHTGRIETVPVPLVWTAVPSFAYESSRPLPLAFLNDARDLRRHALTALDTEPERQTELQFHADPVGLRAVLLAGLAATILPRPALSEKLIDIGPRFKLPQLGAVPVSIYVAAKQEREAVRTLVEELHRQIDRNPR
ncbi:HTH-type transcriptional regulator BenM [Labrenzia sp. THAF82]|uniref:LysR family transcriptional regulator n=1 Tax=Labrenzia sp. THAF82 TaxID=2587861 RepID=UPI001267BDFB|nr:LysR family transcriptional regulator [Labrenzia sp. THAF82]QFT31465.1 HTH-type transcriptional regulator BenM [Labrenzia sp. THAF82]